MSAQETYDLNMSKGYSGQVANIAKSDIVTAIVAAGQSLIPGIFVQRTESVEGDPTSFNKGANYVVSVGGGVAADNLGVAIRDLGREGAPNTSVINYTEADQFPVMRAGYVYMTIPAGGDHGEPIFFNNTTGVINVGTAPVGSSTIDGARLEVTTAAGAVGLVWIPNVITVTAGA